MLNAKDFGAAGNGLQTDTEGIQKAIDKAFDNGGGTVIFPAGKYKTGTLFLKSNITLHLEPGATIVGSSDLDDYNSELATFIDAVGDKRGRCLIYAEQVENVKITGDGTIDGNGGSFKEDDPMHTERPFLIRFYKSKKTSVCGITLKNSAAWVSHYLDCEYIAINNVTIQSRVNLNNDGIDIDSCRNVRISDCQIDTGDDAICVKTTLNKASQNITVNNCVIKTSCAALKLGTESIGDFKNIVMSNCVIHDTEHGGIKLFSVDGARMENIIISNLIMDNVMGPIMMRLGERSRTYHEGQKPRKTGCLKNVLISNITAHVTENEKCPAGICISGVPRHCIEDVTLENINITFPGGCADSHKDMKVPEHIENYPTFNMFGPLPASAFYIRHAKDVTLRNIKVRFAKSDARVPIFCDDVQNLDKERVKF